MKIAVFGANGKTGLEVVKLALDRGYTVVASDLHNNNLPTGSNNLQFVGGSVLDPTVVEQTIQGCGVVVSELGVRPGIKAHIVSQGNKTIVEAMHKLGVKRLITQSAFGAHESWQALPWYIKLAHKTLLRSMSVDKNRMEDIVSSSKLDWTIVRPIRLTNSSGRGTYRSGTSIHLGFNPHIARADVAIFILDEIKQSKFVKQMITLTY